MFRDKSGDLFSHTCFMKYSSMCVESLHLLFEYNLRCKMCPRCAIRGACALIRDTLSVIRSQSPWCYMFLATFSAIVPDSRGLFAFRLLTYKILGNSYIFLSQYREINNCSDKTLTMCAALYAVH